MTMTVKRHDDPHVLFRNQVSMVKIARTKTWLSAVALAAAVSVSNTAAAQAATPWPQAPFSYYAQDQDLGEVLREFAASFSLTPQIARSVAGSVNGRFNAATPTEFLDRLSGVYGLHWFVHAGTLFISRAADMRTATVSPPYGDVSGLRQALLQLGVLDTRFGWGELPEQGLALVSGPPAYVALIERTVDALPLVEGGQQVMVFRLRHASVNDRQVSYRDTSMTTPGLATILRQLLTGSGGANDESLAAIAAPLRNNPPVITETSNGVVEPEKQASGGAAAAGRRVLAPTIQADTRLNAIIVQDIPSRFPIYQELIDQLDVPSTLIEIEAMIVDVNADVVGELGVSWGALSGNTAFGHGNLGLTPSGGLPIDTGTVSSVGMIGLSVGNNLVARIRALEGEGEAQILSQPSILTADNLGALIDMSETFYIQTSGERVATVTPVTVGTSLRVTPRYIRGSSESQVELIIDIEDGGIQDERKIDNLPTVRKSNISTLAIVEDGQALLIGGYNSSQESERIDKVPLLGDIPLVGVLFSNRSRTWQKRERLFMIRPRVVSIDGQRVPRPPVDPQVQQIDAQLLEQQVREARQRRLQLNEPMFHTPPARVSRTRHVDAGPAADSSGFIAP